MIDPFLFLLGLMIGSFLNVVSLRYQPDKFLLNLGKIGGRSHCPHCRTQLRWFELIPLISFLVQGGLCRSCRARLSLQYPLVEFISGLIFVLIPWQLSTGSTPIFLSALWILVFLSLLLVALIDLRLRIIPDELNLFIFLLSFPIILLTAPSFGILGGSFIGHYALLFGGRESIWLAHGLGLFVGLIFFVILIILSRGRGMGGGDMKLGAALGMLFGWPDIGLLIPLAFVLGMVFALPLLISGKRSRKDMLPFGPFLVLSATLVFFFGFQILDFYFHLFRI